MRDSPGRLRAYRRLTGIDFTLLTGTPTELWRFWRFFGVGFFRAPEGRPADLDWWPRRPQRFDVAHTDGLFLVDPARPLKIILLSMPNVRGRVVVPLRRLLNDQGFNNLEHPQIAWTVPQALDDLSALLGRRIRPS